MEAHVISKMMDFFDKSTSLAELMVKELETKYPDHIGWIGQYIVNGTASQLYMSIDFKSYIKLEYRGYVLGLYIPKPNEQETLKQLLLLSD
ncbi:unnamed protein product, partial [Oppiella nova]